MKRGDAASANGDFLDMLLDARFEDGSPLSDKDILDNINTFIFAGQYVSMNMIIDSYCDMILT